MKADVLSLEGKKLKSIDLPKQFSEEYRLDLIKRTILAIRSLRRQKYGANPEAGKRQSSKLSRRRHNYKGAYNRGISRVPRKTMWRRGTQFMWVGAFAPGMVGGRRAHPPKAEKIWDQKINIKEKRKATRSALASTLDKNIVAREYNLPIVLENKFEDIKKVKDFEKVLDNLKLKKELDRTKKKKIRSGKGKMRGRKYKIKKGPLIVVSKKCDLMKSIKNVPGFDVVEMKNINTELISPGIDHSRLTIYTEGAIENLDKNKLFLNIKKEKTENAKTNT